MTDQTQTPDATANDADDLRAAISNALDEAPVTPDPVPVETPEPEADKQAADDAARDNKGRFAPKDDKKDAPKATKGAKPAAKPAQVQAEPAPVVEPANAPADAPKATDAAPALAPPTSWSGIAKADWDKITPAIQRQIIQREEAISGNAATHEEATNRVKAFDAALAPVRTALKMSGVSDHQYITNLVAAETMLRENPQEAFRQLARMYGFDLSQLQGQPGATPAQTQDPNVAALINEVKQLKSQLGERAQREESQAFAATNQEIARFAADPAHRYFNDVKDDMAALMAAGRVKASPDHQVMLKDAYDRACRANPDVHAHMQAEARAAEQAKREAAEKARVEKARNATVTVRGAPTGAATGNAPASAGDVRDDLQKAWDAIAA